MRAHARIARACTRVVDVYIAIASPRSCSLYVRVVRSRLDGGRAAALAIAEKMAIPDVQLNAIERKNLLKLAEQLYKSTHCK